ncbi:MAG TPA: 4-(cytidine 5'-diphospho)-2-C-methyl-D-erythritol kinase [Rhodanobacteraceae bacterium]
MNGWSTWPAPAKVNLFLRIVGRRADGYHLLQTVFRLLDWGDEIRLRVREDGEIVRVQGSGSITAEDDLAVRAARALQRASGTRLGVDIALDKYIPVGAGLGGGSSDAATTLVALNALWQTGMPRTRLAEIGLALGADVPVFVRGRSAWAEGVGEKLTPLELPPRWYAILDPHVHVSTAELFQAPELTRNAAPATIAGFVSGGITDNAFEPVARARYPRVAAALDWLNGFGVARLSGSGGAVFLECDDETRAREVAMHCPAQFTAIVAKGLDISPLDQALVRYQNQ